MSDENLTPRRVSENLYNLNHRSFGRKDERDEYIEHLERELVRLSGALEFADNWFKRTRASTGSMPLGAYQTHEVIRDVLEKVSIASLRVEKERSEG